jgi:hypothetical protein
MESYQITRDSQGNRQVTQGTRSAYPTQEASPVSSGTLANSGGCYRVTVGGAAGVSHSEKLGVERYCPAEDTNGLSGLLSRGTNGSNGQKINGEGDIRDSTLFVVNGVSFPATSAAKAGLLVKNIDGSYSLPGGTQAQTPAAPQAAPQVEETRVIEGQTEHAIQALELLDSYTGSDAGTDALVTQAMAPFLDGNMERATQIFVEKTGVDPEHANALIEHTYDTLRASAAQVMAKGYGVDGQTCFDWIAENCDSRTRNRLTLGIYHGDKSAYAEAAAIYRRGNR